MAILIAALILSLKTDGGFTGRGVGHLSIEGQKVMTDRCAGTITHAESDRLAAAIAAAKKLKWRESYGKVHPDAVLWTLEVEDRKASWYDDNELPKELEELRDEVWKLRERVISECE